MASFSPRIEPIAIVCMPSNSSNHAATISNCTASWKIAANAGSSLSMNSPTSVSGSSQNSAAKANMIIAPKPMPTRPALRAASRLPAP
ncbi:Uncharacterised protein [Pseudomonas putida]|nr:Uncharacterised protein [Pseudomonas putida]